MVRLIDQENEQHGILDTREALEKAREAGLDLVEVAPTSDSATLKEIRLRPETDKHDLEMKLKRGREFLEKGHKLQFTMFFRGRQMLHRDRGFAVLEEITESLQDLAKIERPARMAHRRMTLLLVPK